MAPKFSSEKGFHRKPTPPDAALVVAFAGSRKELRPLSFLLGCELCDALSLEFMFMYAPNMGCIKIKCGDGSRTCDVCCGDVELSLWSLPWEASGAVEVLGR